MTTNQDPRFLTGVRCLVRREWFAVHEAFEDLWRQAHGDDRLALQGLIHIAVALVHLQRHRPEGARSQWAKARLRLADCGEWYSDVAVGEWQRALAPLFDKASTDRPEQEWPVPLLAATLREQITMAEA